MLREYYKDFYGCTASITERNNKFVLTVSAGAKRTKKEYNTYRSAKVAMGRISDAWVKED